MLQLSVVPLHVQLGVEPESDGYVNVMPFPSSLAVWHPAALDALGVTVIV
jgi:hypothetical protein